MNFDNSRISIRERQAAPQVLEHANFLMQLFSTTLNSDRRIIHRSLAVSLFDFPYFVCLFQAKTLQESFCCPDLKFSTLSLPSCGAVLLAAIHI